MASSADPSRMAWRTSSHSNNGGECVEVATAAGVIGVRDTRDRRVAGERPGRRAARRWQ